MTAASISKLFEAVKVGSLQLKHRVALAPLTRGRNDDDHVALPIKQQYYADRATVPGTLVISEATGIAAGQEGAKNFPSFVTDAQVAAWKEVIRAVHDKKSFWFQQLWDQGRAADPAYVASRGGRYISSSAVPMEGAAQAPAEATEEEIQQLIKDFVETARRVIAAGGDGVEIHAAHGYLLDQFLSDQVNKRTDKWGGSVENRARLVLEVVRAVSAAIGADRVGLRLSPYATYQGAIKSDFEELNLYLIEQLKTTLDRPLAYLSLVEAVGDPAAGFASDDDRKLDFILEAWNNHSPVIVAGGFSPKSAQEAVDGQYAKWDIIVAFGRLFIANPDLVYRIQHGLELNKYNRSTFYLPTSEEGLNDYPFSPEYLKASA